MKFILGIILISIFSFPAFSEEGVLDSNGCRVFLGAIGSVTWTGACVDGLVDGSGTLTRTYNARKYVYQGEMSRGEKNGRGILTSPNGDRYEGEWIKDDKSGNILFSGYAKSTNPEGGKYEGYFVDGKRSGKGVLVYANGDRYVGDFVDGKRVGKGVVVYADGRRYEGEFVDDKAAGKGTLTNTSPARDNREAEAALAALNIVGNIFGALAKTIDSAGSSEGSSPAYQIQACDYADTSCITVLTQTPSSKGGMYAKIRCNKGAHQGSENTICQHSKTGKWATGCYSFETDSNYTLLEAAIRWCNR